MVSEELHHPSATAHELPFLLQLPCEGPRQVTDGQHVLALTAEHEQVRAQATVQLLVHSEFILSLGAWELLAPPDLHQSGYLEPPPNPLHRFSAIHHQRILVPW